jgi:uncharacterized spore protein YtfJ
MSGIMQTAADTISQKPEIGIFGSMAGVALSPIAIISLVSAVLGLIVTVITLVIKIMDMVDKVRKKKRGAIESDEVFIDNKRYKRVLDEDDSE